MPRPIQFDEKGNVLLSVNLPALLKVTIIAALAAASYFLPLPGLETGSRICLMIFVGAAGLWVTEAIPPFATGTMVIVLCIYLLGIQAESLGLSPEDAVHGYRIFLNPIASPVLVLFFGGFILAIGAAKHGFDVRLAKAFLRPFGQKPKMVLLGIIIITGAFSMFMSNTATTAMMIAILGPLFSRFEGRDPFKRALVLSVPFAANIGGIGTIIGTPPNAVAASVLGESGYPISFFQWMLIGVPVVIVLLFFLWFMLITIFKPRSDELELLFPEKTEMTWDLLLVVITFIVTIGMWLTQPLHGLPSAVTALLPIMIFTMFGIIDRDDLRSVEWHVLILIAGGMTLGVAMKSTGLSDVLVNLITSAGFSPWTLLIIIILFSLALSNFMSHTSAANLLIPIVTSLSTISPAIGAIGVAFACSLAMSLPISTPPNAIAFATREITTSELVKYGTIVSVVGVGVIYLLILVLVQFIPLT